MAVATAVAEFGVAYWQPLRMARCRADRRRWPTESHHRWCHLRGPSGRIGERFQARGGCGIGFGI